MITYDARTALIVTDIQNDFADPSGSLYVNGGELVVQVANRQIEHATEAGALVVYTQDWHPPVTPHFAKDGGIWPVHCVGDTWGAELHPDLMVVGEVIRKGTEGEDGYSGFTVRDPRSGRRQGTSLEPLLQRRGVARTVIIGLATDYCVKATALDASAKGFHTIVPMEAVAAVELRPGDGERALEAIVASGGEVL
jgi:nicotinamidase/pyrazinamidase